MLVVPAGLDQENLGAGVFGEAAGDDGAGCPGTADDEVVAALEIGIEPRLVLAGAPGKIGILAGESLGDHRQFLWF